MATNLPSPSSLANNLVHAVYEDDYPRDPTTLKTFMFTKCRTEQELKNMLGLYTDLIIDPSFKKKEFICALEERRLVSYIISIFQKKSVVPQYTWFKYNVERWLSL
jgi:hypothetical protein